MAEGDLPAGVGRLDPVHMAVGAAAIAADALSAVVGLSLAAAQRVPVVGSVLTALDQRGAAALDGPDGVPDRAVEATVRRVVAAALRDVDLTDLINEQVDLVVIANRVVDGIDLPSIIHESTGSMRNEAVTGVRLQGMRADDAVTGLVDRVFHRGGTVPNDRS